MPYHGAIMSSSLTSGGVLGWTFSAAVAGTLLLFTFVPESRWQERTGGLYVASFLLLLALGFFLSRFYHDQSPVFHLLYRFGKLQVMGGTSLRDRCLANAGIFGMLGLAFVILGGLGLVD